MFITTQMIKAQLLLILMFVTANPGFSQDISYPVVDTDVRDFYDNTALISTPVQGDRFYGQDATYTGNQPSYRDHGDGTVTDNVTGLTWEKDMGDKISYADAFIKSDTMTLGGFDDWRLPNAKELQSIVDYTRSPQATGSAAIDPLFFSTEILDPDGNPGQYPYYWSGTTHLDGPDPYNGAVYIAFGEAQGEMNGFLMDLHGAGSQRSDPKTGDVMDYPQFRGPQGDVRYVFNAVRCVRNMDPANTAINKHRETGCSIIYPNPAANMLNLYLPDYRIHAVSIWNVFGTQVDFRQFMAKESIDIKHLNPGIYLLHVDGLATGKFIKK